MRTAKQIWCIAVIALLLGSGTATAQTATPLKATATSLKTSQVAKTTPDLVAAANQSKASSEELLRVQEAEITKATTKLEELRQLVSEGLIARVEFEQSEQALAKLLTNIEETRKRIADSDQMIRDIHAAEALAESQPIFPAPVASKTRSFLKPTILRYGGQGSWSLASLTPIQTFFAATFGQSLPTSAVGQSATHNRFGYDHRNAVDVPLHPDSVHGRALISYLQSQGIPFLAFRAAVAGVATGPHIHIGNPSHRLS